MLCTPTRCGWCSKLGHGPRRSTPKIRREANGLIAFLLVVMTWGALMAGLRAGTSHNTFPTMSGYWIPPGMFDRAPAWINLFENGTTVQFIHRWIATLLAFGVLALAIRTRKPETLAAGGVALLQFCLGAATIVSGVVIPVAAAHQGRCGPAPDDPAGGASSRASA